MAMRCAGGRWCAGEAVVCRRAVRRYGSEGVCRRAVMVSLPAIVTRTEGESWPVCRHRSQDGAKVVSSLPWSCLGPSKEGGLVSRQWGV